MANAFEGELAESMKHLDWFVAKLAVPKGRTLRFMRKPPFDFTASDGELGFGIEAKSSDVLGSFPFARLEKHQLEGLEFYESRGENTRSYVLINFRKRREHKKLKRSNIAYAIRVTDWRVMKEEFTRKSIPKSLYTTDNRFIPIPRIKVNNKLIWDLRVLQESG